MIWRMECDPHCIRLESERQEWELMMIWIESLLSAASLPLNWMSTCFDGEINGTTLITQCLMIRIQSYTDPYRKIDRKGKGFSFDKIK